MVMNNLSESSLACRSGDALKALRVVFPQYWLQDNCDDLFIIHLQVIKEWIYQIKIINGSEKD